MARSICRKTGSFSPHLTLGAVGVALSQRKCWQTLLQSKHEYALILEDDISAYAPSFSSQRGLILSAFMACFSMRFFHSAELGLAQTEMTYIPVVGSPTLPSAADTVFIIVT